MAKRAEYLDFHGETFKVHHALQSDARVRCRQLLEDCYQRPSIYKVGIFNGWAHFFEETCEHVYDLGVDSYNCMMFTFGCDADIEYNGNFVQATFYITKTRQEVTIYDF